MGMRPSEHGHCKANWLTTLLVIHTSYCSLKGSLYKQFKMESIFS